MSFLFFWHKRKLKLDCFVGLVYADKFGKHNPTFTFLRKIFETVTKTVEINFLIREKLC